MRRILMAALGAAFIVSAMPAQAEDKKDKLIPGDFSATVTGASEYRFRGISQTDHLPAIQGSIDWSAKLVTGRPNIDVFLGIWASNIDFNDGDDGVIEIDFYGGLRGSIGKFSWQMQFIYYHYPGVETGRNYDFMEFNPSIGYDFGFLSLGGGLAVSPDYFGSSGTGVYLYGDVTVPLPIKFLSKFKPALTGHIGKQWIEKNAVFGTRDYFDWSVGVSFEVEGFSMSIKYVDTDLGNGACLGGTDLCNAAAVFTVSRSF
jgi:uncharacterized protein (TIGR02001 family)